MTRLEAIKQEQDEIKHLMRSVFTSPDGERLLALWQKRYVFSPIFNKDPYVNAARAANADFINDIARIIKETY
jgi:hypothetical protein